MKRIYVAGPYNGPDIISCLDNIRRGIQKSIDVLKAGYAPFCPWLDYHFGLVDEDITREMYQAYSMAWLRVSDAVLVLPGYTGSKGTQAEIAEAYRLNIPVFFSLEELKNGIK